MIKDKHILIGISGGIAAYKAADLVSRLVKKGAKVKVIMTQNACEFISPTTLAAISSNPVSVEHFPTQKIEHITLADWADIFVIAPATANIIGKIANGLADDLLTSTILASTAPKLIVPAMNVHMYENSIVQENIQKLQKHRFYLMQPDIGKLACGYTGRGRLPEPKEILYFIRGYLEYKRDLAGKNILITAGATIEDIDPMRFITNRSTGKTGLAFARAAYIRGANVTLVAANIKEEIPPYINAVYTRSAKDMYGAVIEHFSDSDIVIKSAAVSDYTPKKKYDKKIKKGDDITLELERTEDILKTLGEKKKNQILVGFAAETNNILDYAKDKIKKKNLDYIVANNISVAGKEDTSVSVIDSSFKIYEISGSKFDVANKVLDIVK